MIDLPPHIILLTAIFDTLTLVDWETETGVAGMTVRHARNRYTTSSEKPCVSILWTGIDENTPQGAYLSEWEKPLILAVDLRVDMALPPEESDEDPTGWLGHSRVAAAGLRALQTAGPDNKLYPVVCDWVRGDSATPDPDSKPDDARLVKPLSVLYRVRTDDENVLLAMGANA